MEATEGERTQTKDTRPSRESCEVEGLCRGRRRAGGKEGEERRRREGGRGEESRRREGGRGGEERRGRS